MLNNENNKLAKLENIIDESKSVIKGQLENGVLNALLKIHLADTQSRLNLLKVVPINDKVIRMGVDLRQELGK